ncbi:HNH endonuclease family protein [Amnibacterium kyonggiense]|uniref:Uncharacterized protein DUF1524 n=1 Tax=Amnibacterium kyonggiense TaxID=595671 RepID=A0A4R7FL90_9MICO|nr:HNH endonuclease family protein [Amnibacterium kyonggiense]TDS77171.1 uncharacterized protein DUF1524 [Amnibacterium kyonggiense]
MARRTRRPALVAAPVVLVALVLGAVLTSVANRGGAFGLPDAAPSAAATAAAAPSSAAAPPSTSNATPATSGSALAVLATLPVKGKAPMTGYVRTARFGAAWLDVDRNGCDTRDDVLRRDLTDVAGSRCTVRSGVLHDPYTGRTIHFVRGEGTSTAVQIDHVVPLADAWRTGAQRLSQAQRIALANDPINLFAVDGPTNGQKSDGDAATWLPPSTAFRCTYIAHQVGVKRAYGLWVTPAEKAAMQRILTACPSTPAPASRISSLVSTGSGATPAASSSAGAQ